MKHIKVGILGIGNVAVGTYKALEMNFHRIQQSTGVSIDVIKILNRSPEKDRGITVAEGVWTQDPSDILDNPEIDIVVELIGGIEPASEYMARALKNGKHVVTANKAAIAAKGDMLQKLALENGVMLRFEASVGGGIPILNALTTALLSNDFDEILGIVNGTTNYILTQMTEYGLDYEDVLKDAQEKGFAERDPSGDVEGTDVANKLSILMSIIFGIRIAPEDFPTQGITSITKTTSILPPSSAIRSNFWQPQRNPEIRWNVMFSRRLCHSTTRSLLSAMNSTHSSSKAMRWTT